MLLGSEMLNYLSRDRFFERAEPYLPFYLPLPGKSGTDSTAVSHTHTHAHRYQTSHCACFLSLNTNVLPIWWLFIYPLWRYRLLCGYKKVHKTLGILPDTFSILPSLIFLFVRQKRWSVCSLSLKQTVVFACSCFHCCHHHYHHHHNHY